MIEVLEIGAGSNPAISLPGSLFSETGVRYHAVDADPLKPTRASFSGFHDSEAMRAFYLSRVHITEGAMLPPEFTDQSIDHVIMRSVFGEYTMPPELTGSNQENTFLTLYEAFRVLKVGGKIAFAEECTPWPPATPSTIGETLLSAGFEDVVVYPCQSYENPHWKRERSRYWGLTKGERKSHRIPGPTAEISYLVTATRPEVPIEFFEANVVLNSVWKANSKRGWDHPDNQEWIRAAVFQQSAGPRVPYEEIDKHITVVTKDDTIDLEAYYQAVYAKQRPSLFGN